MSAQLFKRFLLFSFVWSAAYTASAGFAPIALTSDSYNHDLVIENTAPPPVVPVTTASMDNGLANIGFTWFERGYNTDWVVTGLPEAGSNLTSDAAADHLYQFAPSYETNNVLLLDASLTKGTLVLTAPAPYASLSFLTSSGGGDSTTVSYSVNFQDGSTEMGSFNSPDWVGGGSPAWAANGCVNVTTFAYDRVNTDNPRLYSRDVTVSNTSPVISIDFEYARGIGHNAIFAVSGAAAIGAEFDPVAVSGYNEDIVVEAGAIKPSWISLYTSATMDNGAVNAKTTWYEQGYYPLALASGLPAPGAVLTSETAADHRYQMAPSYTNNNAVLLDAIETTHKVAFAKRAIYTGLSFLTASGHGPVTIVCIVNHVDGTSETNLFVSPHWYDNSPAAFTANGCVSVSTKLVTSVNANCPRLFAVDVPVINTTSPITDVVLAFKDGGNDSHAVVFAVSGSADAPPPVTAPTLMISRGADGALAITSTGPGRLQSTTRLDGPNTAWKDEGGISQQAFILSSTAEATRFYRVLAQ